MEYPRSKAFGLGLPTEHVWCGPNAKAHDFGLCASCPKAACRTAVPGTVEFVQVIARNSPIPTQVPSQLSTTIWTSLGLLPTREVLTLREMQMRVEPCKRVFRLRLWSHFRSRLIGSFFSPPWLLERKGSFSGPFSGPILGAPLQALPFLRWCNAAVASAPAEAPVDETSLNLMPGALKGAIAPSGRLASRCATLSARRANATYMASVCSDSALQPNFPQVLLLNQRLLGKEGPGHLGGSLFVWVQKSAWVNASAMRRWLSLLRQALQPRVGARTVLVFVDAAPPHLHASVWAHTKRCAVRLLLIPRGLTRLLQRQQMSRCLLGLKLC